MMVRGSGSRECRCQFRHECRSPCGVVWRRRGRDCEEGGELTDETSETQLELHAIESGRRAGGARQHTPLRFNWSYENRELFSESAERYVRAVCVLLAENMVTPQLKLTWQAAELEPHGMTR